MTNGGHPRSSPAWLLAAMLLFASPGFAQAPPASGPPPLTLEALERMALENNPTLAQADAEVDAAKGRAKQAGLFPNPTVGYTGEEISRGPIIRGGEHGFFVEQMIPLGGKLRLSRNVFEREASQADALREAQRLRVLNTVRVLYYEALTAARRVEVNERLALLAAEAVDVSQQLFNVGAADKPDLLESEIEAQRAGLALVAARNQQHGIWRRLAAAAGTPDLAPSALVGSLDTALPEIERGRALQRILTESPEIRAARALVKRAELAVRRAQRETVPDLVVRGGPRYNRELLEIGPTGSRPVGWEAAIEAGISLPLFNRNQGNIASARADLERARSEVRRLELTLDARLAGVFDDYLTSLRTAEAYRTDILPRAEQAYDLFLARFREMAAAYPQVLIAQRTLFQVNEQYLEALDWRLARGGADSRLPAARRPRGAALARRDGGDAGPWNGDGSTAARGAARRDRTLAPR